MIHFYHYFVPTIDDFLFIFFSNQIRSNIFKQIKKVINSVNLMPTGVGLDFGIFLESFVRLTVSLFAVIIDFSSNQIFSN